MDTMQSRELLLAYISCRHWQNLIDRASISKHEHTSQLHTHLAHALIRYLGVESVNDLTTYGIDSIVALVDLVSRVSCCVDCSTSLAKALVVYRQCICLNFSIANANWCLYFAHYRDFQSFLRPERRFGFPSRTAQVEKGRTNCRDNRDQGYRGRWGGASVIIRYVCHTQHSFI
jgi:hypothetical protein